MPVEKLPDLLARLYAHPRRRLTLLIGVDGEEETAITAFSGALAALDPGLHLVGPGPWEVEGAVDWRRFRADVVRPLSHDRGSVHTPVGGMVLVRGVGACRPPLTGDYDFRVWVGAGDPPAGVAWLLLVDPEPAGLDPRREYRRR